MVKTFAPFATSAAILIAAATATAVPDGSWPASTGTVQYSEAYIIKAGEVFDGKMQTFERSDVSCEGQTESGADTAVFKMEPGATLKNAIIGKNQMEGVHCDKHDCTIENVWWDDVCEDALSIKGGTASSVSTVTNCGARYADDKVIQHNGYGTVKIDSFYGEDISKLYRSCGTCGDRPKKVSVTNSYIVNPTNSIVTVNKNWGDQATLKNIWIKSSKASVKVCQWSQGNANGEPKMLGNGPSPPLCSVPDGSWPASTGTVQYSEAYIIKAGEVFDGKMQTFERSDVSCEGQTESGADTAVFKMEPGATLKNAIIGKNQMEGVHCDKHDCTIENVWWDDVCEDALSIKGGTASSVSTVTNCGARYADDKVIQHNGYGTVKIDSFYGEDISKLYRSCGTCGDRPKKVSVTNSYIVNPTNSIVTVNKNWGDQATLKNIWIKSSKASVKVCQWSQGNANGEPKMLGNGPSPPLCQYSESDVHINEK
ncbi:pectate lyase D [Phytophthora nicotianae]|nr:pectate lyase D [Phytophthora nicotianae]